MKQNIKENTFLFVKLLVGILYCMPVLLAIMFAFHTNEDIGTIPLKFFTKFSLDNFQYVFENVPILTYLKNTVIMLVIILPIQVIL